MTLHWKTWALIGIVAIAVVAAVAWKQFGANAPTTTGGNQANQEAPITAPQDLPVVTAEPATGNIDDAVAAVLAGAAADEAFFADAAKDADLVGADSQTITNLGQSSYANEI